MSAFDTFCFSGYTLRPAASSDLSLAQEWTVADPYHRDTTPAEFWLEQKPGRDSYLLSDGGGPIFFFKMEKAPLRIDPFIILHVQFMPTTDENAKERVREGLRQGMEWLKRVARMSGVHELMFQSSNPELSAFCRRRLGFDVCGDDLLAVAV